MTKDTGGYAFPHVIEHLHEPVTAGMTLRDYFAAKAMQSWLTGVGSPIEEMCAAFAYRMADAMLKAREQ